jgi:uncharacterized protein (DUF927 family)
LYSVSFEYKGKNQVVELKRVDLSFTGILKLAAYGADVYSHNYTNIIKHLRNEETIAPNFNIHTGIGFATIENQYIFKHFKAIGMESQYRGNLGIKPKGSLEAYLKMLKEEVLGTSSLELMFNLGLSSTLVGFVGDDVGVSVLLVHLKDNSTTGKTTSCALAVSTAGNPNLREMGLMKTWNGTFNSIIKSLNNNNGLPVVLDEASMSKMKDFTELIYILANGKEKTRLDEKSNLKDIASWRTTIISNGEFALTQKAKENAGIMVRLLELSELKLTRSAENAEQINKCISNNHALIAPLMAEELIKMGKDKVVEKFKKWRMEVIARLKNIDKFADRLSAKIALIMTTCEISSSILGLNWKMEEILDILVENEVNNKIQRDIYQKAYEYFLEQVEMNRGKFITEENVINESISTGLKNAKIAPLERWGKINQKGKIREISILKSKFKSILQEGGFEDETIILKRWKESEWLSAEKDKLYRKRQIDPKGSAVGVYVVMSKIEEGEDEKKKTLQDLREDRLNAKKIIKISKSI